MKTCNRCKKRQPFDRFAPRSSTSPKRRAICRDCTSRRQLERYHDDPTRGRAAYLMRQHGIMLDDYQRLFDHQAGRCAICDERPTGPLHVDHDHSTGAIRGLLCVGCNTGLGGFRDDPRRLASAADYLTREPAIFFARVRNHTVRIRTPFTNRATEANR